MAKSTQAADPVGPADAPLPDPLLEDLELAPAPVRDPLDATKEEFTDWDADERGWLVFYEPPDKDGARPFHRVPVAKWARYERAHGF